MNMKINVKRISSDVTKKLCDRMIKMNTKNIECEKMFLPLNLEDNPEKKEKEGKKEKDANKNLFIASYK